MGLLASEGVSVMGLNVDPCKDMQITDKGGPTQDDWGEREWGVAGQPNGRRHEGRERVWRTGSWLIFPGDESWVVMTIDGPKNHVRHITLQTQSGDEYWSSVHHGHTSRVLQAEPYRIQQVINFFSPLSSAFYTTGAHLVFRNHQTFVVC